MRPLLALCIVIFLTYSSQSLFLPLIPLYTVELGYTATDVGLVAFFNLLASSVLAIPFGLLSDRLGRKTTIAIGVGIATVGAGIFVGATNIYLIVLAYTLIGVGHGGYGSGSAAYPADMGLGKGLARAVASSQTVRQVGFIVGPMLGSFIKVGLGYFAGFITALLLMSSAFLVSVIALPNLRSKKTLTKEEPTSSSKGIAKMPIAMMAAVLFAVFSTAFATGTFYAFVPLYSEKLGFHAYAIGFIFAAQALTNSIIRPVIGEFLQRTNREVALLVGSLVTAFTSMFVLGYSSTVELILIIGAVLGFSHGTNAVVAVLLLSKLSPESRRGFILSFFNTFLYLGLGSGPAVIGFIIDLYGFDAGFKLGGAVCLAGVLVFSVATRKRLIRMV